MGVMIIPGLRRHSRGFCYLYWFDALNLVSSHRLVYDLRELREKFGCFPRIRNVLGYLYIIAERDVFLPAPRLIAFSCYHVEMGNPVVRLSSLFQAYCFDAFVIGGDVGFIEKNLKIKRMTQWVNSAGLHVREVVPEATRRLLRDEFTRDSLLLRDVIMDALPAYSIDSGSQFFFHTTLLHDIQMSSTILKEQSLCNTLRIVQMSHVK